MNILSLFDGISCGRLALERAGIKVDKYFASEVDKYAIQIAKKNFPDTIHIGSVTDVKYDNRVLYTWYKSDEEYEATWVNYEKLYLADIDMIIWWSPCQDLSIAKKWGQWLQGEKSSLFFEYVRLLREVKPKYFLLENVASMKKADKEEITRILTEIYPDVQCYLINSALVSAQNRKRLYWTNIQWVEQPDDKGMVLKDILEPDINEDYFYEHRLGTTIKWANALRKEKWSRRTIHQKSKCTTAWWQWITNAWATNISIGWRLRKLTPIECERLQTLPDNYSEGVSNTQRYKAIGNGWTVDVIAHIFSYIK